MQKPDSWISRALTPLAKRIVRVRSVQDVRRARDVLRIGIVFAFFILVPAMLLSLLALSTLRSEELFVDAEYRSRTDAMTEQLSSEVIQIFERFESATRTRLDRGESPLDHLGDLSPYLRGAYRFDPSGRLAAPFEVGGSVETPEASARFRALWSDALATERAGDAALAAARYLEASQAASHPVHAAEARLAQARSWAAAGRPGVATQLLAALRDDHPLLRESHGYRIGDLASLISAEIQFAQDPVDTGPAALQSLVDRLLNTRWTIGQPGESTVVARALEHLAGVADPDWVALRRADLNDRRLQLLWTGLVAPQLELVGGESAQGTQFNYFETASLDSPAVWATIAAPRGTYVFSFSLEQLTTDLAANLLRMNEHEEWLTAELLLDSAPIPESATSRTLGQPLSMLQVVVAPAAPEALAELKSQRRIRRIVVVLVSVFLVAMGVLWSARTIGHEMESARVKADFAANVSHELRSPITQIRLKGEALQLGLVEPGDDTVEHYDAIVREAERLSRLVDNVLDFAAIERGAKRYQLRVEDLLSVVWATVEANRQSIEDLGLTLEIDLPDDLPPVWLDREAIGQVLVNLMSNAAKYGSEGGWIGVRVRQGLNGIDLAVADRGMGIPQDEIAHIFDHFYRSGDTRVRRKKGTGIGLTIVRYIVEAHGGTISVDSTPGHGTTFTVTFPFQPPPGAGAAT